MSQKTVNVRMDEEVKRDFEIFCAAVGLNVSVAMNLFAKAVIREQRLPFEVGLNVPNEVTKKAIDDVRNRKNLSREFSSVSELMEDLYADD